MGTHPIFESDFDCLTDTSGLSLWPNQQPIFQRSASMLLKAFSAQNWTVSCERNLPKTVIPVSKSELLPKEPKLSSLPPEHKRFQMKDGQVELFAEKVANRGLCAIAQCESLRYKLMGGLAVRRAAYGVLRFIMESGAKGCEVVISGKLRGQRAKAMKFTDGLMI